MEDETLILNLDNNTFDSKTFQHEWIKSGTKHRSGSHKQVSKLGNKSLTEDDEGRQKLLSLGIRGVANLEKRHASTKQHDKVISSLFTKNPDIPSVTLKLKDSTKPTLFTKDKDLTECKLEDNFMSNLKLNFGVKQFTRIQSMTFPHVLAGHDCLVKSPTGSGKTLAYAVPIIHMLKALRPKIKRSDGTFVLVILPTRELALQSYDVLEILCRTYVWLVPGILVGGEKKKSEKSRLRKGINVLVATPGRLLDHIKTTRSLNLSQVRIVVFDEADRLLDMGFEKDINLILSHVKSSVKNEKQQTILVSATLTKQLESLAQLNLHEPRFIDSQQDNQGIVECESNNSCELQAPSTLKQNILFVPAKLRLVALVAMLKKQLGSNKGKVMVFVSSKTMVTYLSQLLEAWLKEQTHLWHVYQLHGDMTQAERTLNFKKFKESSGSVLFCTNVCARGLDLPFVTCIIQYTCSGNIEEYIHRSGRTARMGSRGEAVLFLLPSESSYVNVLQDHKLALKELQLFDILSVLCSKACNSELAVQEAATSVQLKLEEIVENDKKMTELAAEAFQTYIQAYATYPKEMKEVFDVKSLHLGHIAKSFALRQVPKKMVSQCLSNVIKPPVKSPLKRKVLKSSRSSEHDGGILSGPRPGKKKRS